MKKVLVFGTFDVIHKGHENFLKQSRRNGDYLIAVVTRDSNVKKMKGRRPIQNEKMRTKALRKFVDRILIGEKKVTYNLIKKISPDVICIGYDQKPGLIQTKKIMKSLGMEKVAVKKMKPYKPHIYKSSILNKLR